MNVENQLKSKIRDVPDYPKKGILFKDITPLLKDKETFSLSIEEMNKQIKGKNVDLIAGIEARGFIIGSALALKSRLGFVPIRKVGKLPWDKVSKEYSLEYGNAVIEMHKDAIEGKHDILIVDDLLATGGTAVASAELIESMGGKVSGFAFLIELTDLKGRERLKKYDVTSLLKY